MAHDTTFPATTDVRPEILRFLRADLMSNPKINLLNKRVTARCVEWERNLSCNSLLSGNTRRSCEEVCCDKCILNISQFAYTTM